MRPLQCLLFDLMKSSFKMQSSLYLGLNTKFKLNGMMLLDFKECLKDKHLSKYLILSRFVNYKYYFFL